MSDQAPVLEAPILTTSISDIEEYFQLELCKEWCASNGFTNVALQFPDHLLAFSPKVYSYLSRDDLQPHILADTNYGACCVDQVAAQRLDTQALIHFGHSCNSRVLSLPTLFIFGKEPIDVDSLVISYKQTYTRADSVWVVFDSVFYHCVPEFREKLKIYTNMSIKRYSTEQNTGNSSQSDTAALQEVAEYSVFYIGSESLALTMCVLTNGSRQVTSYDPVSKECRLESRFVNKMLIKRFSYIEKIKESSIIGILVGTLGIKNFRGVIERCKAVIKAAGKKCYVVSIGKPNPPKLANLPEIEVYVMVGCPENSILDSADFYQPIVTPYELEIACVERTWDVDYISDSSTLIDTKYIDIPSNISYQDENSKAIQQLKSLDIAVNYLNERTWSGLQQRLGEDEAAILKEGQRGIAGQYEDEPDYIKE